jgi:hypothetical protein
MKKKFVIIIIAQTILIFVMLIFAFIQKTHADKAIEEAIASQVEAIKQKEVAFENVKIARELSARYDSLLQIQNSK